MKVDVAIILQNAAVYLTNPVARRVSDQPRVNACIHKFPSIQDCDICC